MNKKVLIIFGTRPDAIKMCPLVQKLLQKQHLQTITCVTGQHREMLQQVLSFFHIEPNYNLNIMQNNQTLFEITIKILEGVKSIIEIEHPDLVIVHGDTTAAFASSLAAYYLHIPVAHVEAGLRTYDAQAPFPEEFNRQSVSIIANYHFAPTQLSRQNLLNEGKHEQDIYVTGNTIIDVLAHTVNSSFTDENLQWAEGSRLVLLTAHRRENLGEPLRAMFQAIRRVMDELADVKLLFPIHRNPAVRQEINCLLECDRIRLIEPLDVFDFHNYMSRAYLILTDSGGIQEEAPSLGKPVLVLRNVTERPEGLAAGTLMLAGNTEQSIYDNFKLLMTNQKLYDKMTSVSNPYGDGHSSQRIADIIEQLLKG